MIKRLQVHLQMQLRRKKKYKRCLDGYIGLMMELETELREFYLESDWGELFHIR